jgi:hypothetical protein
MPAVYDATLLVMAVGLGGLALAYRFFRRLRKHHAQFATCALLCYPGARRAMLQAATLSIPTYFIDGTGAAESSLEYTPPTYDGRHYGHCVALSARPIAGGCSWRRSMMILVLVGGNRWRTWSSRTIGLWLELPPRA